MFFRPIEPRGDVLDATRHLIALGLLVPVIFVMVAEQILSSSAQFPGNMDFVSRVVAYVQLLFLPLSGLGWRAWIPLAAAVVLTLALHFVFYMSLMTLLSRMRALSLANVLVGTTALAAVGALLPVITGYGAVEPKYRLPLFEDFAQGFLLYALLLGVGGLLEWICIRSRQPQDALA
jgi:hypothetical protein